MTPKNTSKTLGPIETDIVARLTYEKKTIVTAGDFDRLFNLSPNDRKQVVFRLKKKKILSPIKRGVYAFSPLEAGPEGTGVDELLIPPLFFPKKNYYVGYSTVFNYYGFTEQLFQTVYVLNTTMRMERIICGISYKFIRILENRMYGLETIKVKDADVNISSRERTLIDLLYFNKPVGGITAAVEIFTEIVKNKKCDIKKLIEYAARFPNITTRKRIGLILEGIGASDTILKPLIKSVEETAVSSFDGSRKGTLNKKWRVIVNDSRK
ncbi:MAG: type IV toxin-antitoxin system AbiEi family antitoxin [Candidatus Omnitrophota bacterium]|nr:type IV toxin-antitoxin system AbiEi family antitoxin [Candidatus Omnitrophota bacterium]